MTGGRGEHGVGVDEAAVLRSMPVLALALDMDDPLVADRLARRLQPFFSVAKVGLELFTAVGPDAVAGFRDLGYDVFLDLKLHDIPTTVAKAAAVAGSLGARFLTMHAAGGVVMLRAGVEGFHAGADRAGVARPEALGVTVLTSEADVATGLLSERVDIVLDAGCDGLVCAGADLTEVRRRAPDQVLVVPGTRLPGGETHDQARPTTPFEAVAAGADVLVIGRMVTHAPDPVKAAEHLVEHLGGTPTGERPAVAPVQDRSR